MDTSRKDNPMAFAFVDHNYRLIAMTNGKVVSAHRHEVTIPALEKTTTLYFVSQSKFFTQFSLPSGATVIVDGVNKYRRTALIRPAMNPVDAIQMWELPPSTLKWPLVPESTLDFDDFIAQEHVPIPPEKKK
jgi:hypothetical protein